jgi:hypothetical protein
MRPAVRFAAALGLAASLAAVPDAAAQGLTVSGVAGVNLSDVVFRSQGEVEARGRPALTAGGAFAWNIWSRLSFEVDALYSRRRTEFSEIAVDRLTYFELPLLVRWRVFDRPGWSVYAVGGAVQAWLRSAVEEVGGETLDIDAAISDSDLAAAVGAQVRVGRVYADVRYLHGLSDLYEPALFNAKHRTLQILVGFQLLR